MAIIPFARLTCTDYFFGGGGGGFPFFAGASPLAFALGAVTGFLPLRLATAFAGFFGAGAGFIRAAGTGAGFA